MLDDEPQHDLNLLAAHLEDRLDGPERERLTLHLADCLECRETLATLARGAALLPRPASAAPASPGRWQVPGIVWLPLAATLIVAVATLTRLGWWTAPNEGPPAAVASASPTLLRETAAPSSPPPTEGTALASALPVPHSARTVRPTEPAASDKRVLVLRGAQRRVGGKTFRLVFGEWIDADFDAAARLPEVSVSTPEERSELLSRIPTLAPFAALGERVLVVHDGTVYRFRLDPSP